MIIVILYFWKRVVGRSWYFCLFIYRRKAKSEFARRTSSASGRFLNQAQTSGVEQSNLSTKLDFDPLEEEKQQWKVTSRYSHNKKLREEIQQCSIEPHKNITESSIFSYHPLVSEGAWTVGPARLLLQEAYKELVTAATRIICNTYSGTWSSPAVLLLLPFLLFERLLLR